MLEIVISIVAAVARKFIQVATRVDTLIKATNSFWLGLSDCPHPK